MKYKFEQFNTEIVNPKVTVVEDATVIHPTRNTIDILINLEVQDSSLKGIWLHEVKTSNMNYEGYDNLLTLATKELSKYSV